MTVSQHYSRPARLVSSRGLSLALTGLCLIAANVGFAQYPGQVNKKAADKTPEMRAVAVLEWTGDAGKPTASRIVPVTIYDGEQLQDAGLYLARPYPLAVSYAVEYELKDNGKTIGLFEVKNAGQVQGSWVGFGDWKPLPKPKAAAAPQKIDEDLGDDDKPVLHRKHKGDDSSAKSGGTASSNTKDAKSNSSAEDDPDRPKLHKKTEDTTTENSGGSAPVDPDRPMMTKPKPKAPETPVDAAGNVSSLPDIDDPDRPRLKRGAKDAGPAKVEPTLMGLPDDMKQAVAISDARNRPEHTWTYSWANPDDEMKMKEQMEDIARKALGITPPPPPAKTSTAHRSTAAKKVVTPPPPTPAPLEEEQFRVFELAYGAGATMVLSAHTTGPLADQKFVTLIAQPDLYGNVMVLVKNVTDRSRLDETPRMRLVDAVDALADNRGELLFELRGDTTRQFALYRIMRGRADKLFTTFGGNLAGNMPE
ncbi:hypothetical protein [Occallatibacter riparius]|uniref:Uncharacterized protein n=1 Tax=Occallatibacter riparius TaxID=1002689 RepID=A0A9J7BUI9_9BACT|nr:hypothetical protein [Occallatibacter riparius]UWZ86540.1 hypothetical protein MOP44_11475 [Occallatibacter riparius]